MQMAKISLPKANKRLNEIYNQTVCLATSSDVVVDVGADHGYLAAMLAKTNMFKQVIATDISAPSLEKTKKLAKGLNLNIETRVGDGLTVAQEATLACICGMGGYEIIKILETNPKVQKFVLQPVQNPIELRLYLLKRGYKIVNDFVIKDKDKFYYIISINGFGKNKYNKLNKLFGKNNLIKPDEDFYLYLKNQINKLKFLEKFDIKHIERKQRKQIRQKQKYYQLCKKLLKTGSAI